jgi:hypothetical protein
MIQGMVGESNHDNGFYVVFEQNSKKFDTCIGLESTASESPLLVETRRLPLTFPVPGGLVDNIDCLIGFAMNEQK